jgi:hypothetical protein
VECTKHGEGDACFICGHLPGAVGAGFFHGPSRKDPRPDAWCARCDEVLRVEKRWNARSEAFAEITVRCSGCYDEIRERNRWIPAPRGAAARFTCASCGEVHRGLPTDFGVDAPDLREADLARATRTPDTCVLGEDRFVRACLELPVRGGAGPLVYGAWVSLSAASYDEFCRRRDARERYLDGPYFGWLSNQIPGWPETLRLKTRVHVRPPPLQPVLELEPTDHALAVAQREGLSLEQFRDISLALLHAAGPKPSRLVKSRVKSKGRRREK